MSKPIKSVEEYINWTKQLDGGMLLFRGLAKSKWEVESSAYRRIKKSLKEEPTWDNWGTVQEYNEQLLENVRLRYKDSRKQTDLDLLADLQHHGAATFLIDFTENALIALWFACRGKPTKHGKVVAIATDNSRLFSTVGVKDLDKPIEKLLKKRDRLWKWTPGYLNNRIISQQSVFVFGDNVLYEFIEYHHNVLIDKGSKRDILESLKNSFGVKEENLFNDLPGFALCNAHDKKYDKYTAEDYFYSGLTFQQQREYEKAIDYYDKALEFKPPLAKAYNNRGLAKFVLGDHQGAISDYSKAIKQNPRYADAYNNRGNAKNYLGDHQDAISDYDKAIKYNPQSAEAYNNRGVAKRALGNYQGAIADHSKALKQNPRFAEAYNNRGVAKSDSGDHEGAISDYTEAIKLKGISGNLN